MYVRGQKDYFCFYVRIVIGPVLTPPPNSCSLPPHDPPPPRAGRGAGGRFIKVTCYIQLTQPHMLRVPTFPAKLG
jgi:hypothetical protein